MPILIEYAANLFDAIAGTWFVLKFNKSNIKSSPLFIPIILTLFTTFNLFTHLWQDFSAWQNIIILIVLWFYAFTIKKSKILNKILSSIIYNLVMIIVNSMIVFILSNIMNVNVIDLVTGSLFGRSLYLLLCKIIMTTILLIIIRIFSIENHFHFTDLFLYLFSPFASILNLYIFIKISLKYNISEYSFLIIISIISIALINIFTAVLFKKAVESVSTKYELELLNNRNKLEEERYIELGKIYSKLQITRHDIHENLIYINYLVENNEYDKVTEFIKVIKKDLDKSKHIYHTNNRMIDYIIDSKLSEYSDTTFTLSGKLGETSIIDDHDMVSLFGNMLNNAIEGANTTESKQIEIEFSVNGNYQNIVCKNSINGSVLSKNPEFKTSKKDKSKHGYGIKSMRRIVEKYDGLIDFYEENEKFCVHIALPIKSIEGNS